MQEDPMLRLQYYRETGQADEAAQYERYLRETGQWKDAAPRTVQAAATPADATRVGPGPKNPGARELTGMARVASDVFEHGIPFTPIPGAADFANPITGLLPKMAEQATGAAVLPYAGRAVRKVAGRAGDVVSKGAGRAMALVKKDPGDVLSLARDVGTAQHNPFAVWRLMNRAGKSIKALVGKGNPGASVEGFVGNSMDNLRDAGSYADDVVQAANPTSRPLKEALEQAPGKPYAPRHRTKAQFDYFAERMAERAAAEEAGAAEPTLEDLLAASIKHVRQGGSLRQASDVASRATRSPFPRTP